MVMKIHYSLFHSLVFLCGHEELNPQSPKHVHDVDRIELSVDQELLNLGTSYPGSLD
jgi:hypothetical protein